VSFHNLGYTEMSLVLVPSYQDTVCLGLDTLESRILTGL